MTSPTMSCLTALSVLLSCAACAAPEPDPGAAEQGLCHGFYIDHVVARDDLVFFVSPAHLAMATDVEGPQTMSLSVDQGFSPSVSYEESPEISLDKNKVTRSLQATVG